MGAIARDDITGMVLAGGQGRRMGGVDKGLQRWRGQLLVRHAIDRLAPQVGPLRLSANRHLAEYAEACHVPIHPDDPAHRSAGPLAGWLAGLTHVTTPFLLTVPCDTPRFPVDLAQRLADALQAQDAEVAMATTPGAVPGDAPRLQPAFCLMRRELEAPLAAFLASGGRQVSAWATSRRCAFAAFEDEAAFFNINTPEDLAAP